MLENPPRGSLEDITENIFGIKVPQRSKRHQDMYDTAKEYYRLLKSVGGANSTELVQLKDKLDQMSAPSVTILLTMLSSKWNDFMQVSANN